MRDVVQRPLYFFGALTMLAVLERASKHIARATFPPPPSEDFFITWAFTQNPGIAFGLPVPISILLPLTCIVLVTLIAVALTTWQQQRWIQRTALALLLLGGASNIFDRIRWGGVTDIAVLAGGLTFNGADIFILLGIVLWIWTTHHQTSSSVLPH